MNEDIISSLIQLAIFLGFMALGYLTGTMAERRHYRSIEKREKQYIEIPTATFREVPFPKEQVASVTLVAGSAVISIDYFKRVLAKLRNIFGGTVKSYESLIDRARREAVLRMKEQALDADIIVNVRIETSAIGKYRKKRSIGCLEALAYGTAVRLHHHD
jgi:uncharacterized protein YbjQ (UPF0145 family)